MKMNESSVIWSVSIFIEAGILLAFIMGLFAVLPTWLLIVFIILSVIATSILVLMGAMAGQSGNKVLERQIGAIALPSFTLGILSGLPLFITV